MAALLINGGKRLCGSVRIQGSKNGILPILASCLLIKEECVIDNCPEISDVNVSLKILKSLGAECSFQNGTVSVNAAGVNSGKIDKELMCAMRSSVIYMGALLSRAGSAVITDPGGCDLGPRPIDLHIAALEKLGAEFSAQGEYIYCERRKNTGGEIHLPYPSVGATENVILASVLSGGKTVIFGAALEPEISDLANFLNSCGAKISGAGTKTVIIEGVKNLCGTHYRVSPDRIAACTYLSAFAVSGGAGEITDTKPDEYIPFTQMLHSMGCFIKTNNNSVYIKAPQKLISVSGIKSNVYPAFPTDAGPLAVTLMSGAKGNSRFCETVFKNRFSYVPELIKMGADIKTSGDTLFISGSRLTPANIACADLRAGAALIIAALSAKGESRVEGLKFIDRGYEKIEENLQNAGADIKRL